MNSNDPRLERIHRAQTGDISPAELAQLETDLRDDVRFREVYVRYWNMDLALGAVAHSSPVTAAPTGTWISTLARRMFRRRAKVPLAHIVPANERMPMLNWRLGFALLAVAIAAYFIPLPQSVLQTGEQVFQRCTAEVAYWSMQSIGTPVTRNDLVFHMPGLNLEFSEACSGFRPTLVLLAVGAVLVRWILKTPWRRLILLLVIVPFVIVEKGLWVATIATLAVRIDPDIVSSWFYHRGEAINLTLSLLALFGLAWFLYRSERTSIG